MFVQPFEGTPMDFYFMLRSRIRACVPALWLALAGQHCQDQSGLLVPDRGLTPRAEARVAGQEGEVVTIPFTGEPITLTLDASRSVDPDGRITRFRWLSGVRNPAAGSGATESRRVVPDGADPDWPDDVEKPQVSLGEGSYAFSLWVTDDQGLVSAPDVLRVVVAAAP
jgi:hypothetical protein